MLERDWNQPIRYPDPAVEVIDPRFRKYILGSSAIERKWTGARWAEGPVWFGDTRSLIWSDIPNDRMLRWSEETGHVSIFRQPSNNANGNTRDRQGRLITCEHQRRVTRTEYDGTVTVLMDGFEGKRLNAPNDVVVHPDGGIWFTDPGYGIHWNYEGIKGDFELPTRTYRFDPETLEATVVDEDLVSRVVAEGFLPATLQRGQKIFTVVVCVRHVGPLGHQEFEHAEAPPVGSPAEWGVFVRTLDGVHRAFARVLRTNHAHDMFTQL